MNYDEMIKEQLLWRLPIEQGDLYLNRNTNPNNKLFLCQNGTLDLENLIFIPTASNPNYSVEYLEFTETNPGLLKVKEYIERIHPSAVDFWAQQLLGGDGPRKIYIHSGSNAGISTLFRLVELIFGEYTLKLRSYSLTNQKYNPSIEDAKTLVEKDIRLVLIGNSSSKMKKIINNPFRDGRNNIVRSVHIIAEAGVESDLRDCEVIEYESKFYSAIDNLPKSEEDRISKSESNKYFQTNKYKFASVFLYMIFEKYKEL